VIGIDRMFGVDGSKRVGPVASVRSSGAEFVGEVGLRGDGKVVEGAGADRGEYEAFWSRRENEGVVGDRCSPTRANSDC